MTTTEGDTGGYVILGASGDIGSAVARLLKEDGCNVFLASRPSDRLDLLADELQSPCLPIDATGIQEVQNVFDSASEAFGQLRGAVNCVGSILLKPAHMTSAEEWEGTIATNLTSAFATVRAAAKTMLKSGGSIVLLSSAAASVGLTSHEAISAAKAGVTGLAKSAAATYASRNLRFNVVAPGLVKTKLTKRIWESERAAHTSKAMHPLGRMGEPHEVAAVIRWLLDPAQSWLTGDVIAVDGGLANLRSTPRG